MQTTTQPTEGMLARWFWREPAAATDPAIGPAPPIPPPIDPLLARLLAIRGITGQDDVRRFLTPRLSDLHDPARLAGADPAARRLCEAVGRGQPIVIYGDYDVDGITATAILYHTLREAGAKVRTYVPHRIDEGYGLNTAAIERFAAEDPQPLVISVDCGITAVQPAAAAKAGGMDLIITDHHHFDPHALPEAAALVHPGLPHETTGTAYPCEHLCGAGVAFKLAWQFARRWCASDRLPASFRDLMVDLLSLVALGTVADVVPLRDENRGLTVFGLGRIKKTRFEGLGAMIRAARLGDESIDAYHIGFVLGPRLNACGRMGHAERAVRLLTTAAGQEADEIAAFLTKENDRRRATERAIFDQALAMVEAEQYAASDRRAIVLGQEGWHPGVIGIVASRLVERYSRPVVMLALDDQGNAKGSARSVDSVHLHDALAACAQYLDRFGGHAMAAGMTLPAANVPGFREALNQAVHPMLAEQDMVATITLDAPIDLADCTLAVFEQLQALAPFGRGNPGPRLLLSDATLDRGAELMGREGKHLALWLRQGGIGGLNGKGDGGGRVVRAVGFGLGHLADRLPRGVRVDVAFTPKVSTWRGRSPELHIQDIRLISRPCVPE